MENMESNILNVANNDFNYFMSLENVIGVGLGSKKINNIITKEPAIHVLVEKKFDEKFISRNNIVPRNYKGLKTDVIEIGKCSVSQGNAIPYTSRPLRGGCGISLDVSNLSAGTLGCIVYKKNNGKNEYYILSNNHLLTNKQTAPIGTPIIQPSFLNGGRKGDDVVAYLSDYVIIKFINSRETDDSKQPSNYTDCAIARIYNSSLISSKIINIGEITGQNIPRLNDNIKKVGFISGLKEGFITTVGLTLKIKIINNNVSIMKQQFLLSTNNNPGDSGCVVLNDNNEIVGLTFAATTSGNTITNDINIVLRQLNAKIYTTETLV